MRVLFAPDKFRGTLTAAEAARALARGWRRVRPGDETEEVPMADGGEGTLDALVAALEGERRSMTVTGPLGEPVEAAFGLVRGANGPTGVVEMALASGLALVPDDRRDPRTTTTFGTGELILAACRAGARSVVVCIGGSGTNDGGAGMAQALGFRLLDRDDLDLARGGAALASLDRIEPGGRARELDGVGFVAAIDVDNPLTGPSGASAVYGPQKGLRAEDVPLLDAALARLAEVVRRDLGVDAAERPGAGAAGGVGFGLMAFLGAEVRSGIDVVMQATRFDERLSNADAVVTGEGKFDHQSFRGKTVGAVLEAARARRVPAAVVAGRAEAEAGGAPVLSLIEVGGQRRAFDDAAGVVAEAAAQLAARSDWR
ncbi:MAG TPA: glycerate kinase [Actinomycetota bacterium]|nr:glycerate kinase [Actinomycetota bacterium]